VARRILLGDNMSGGAVMLRPIMLEFRVSNALPFLQYAAQINPCTGLDRPRGFQEFEVPRFRSSRHTKLVRLSALRTGRLYSSENILGTRFC